MPTVNVKLPANMSIIFEKAANYECQYFASKKENPSKGTITIKGERYILIKAASLSEAFLECMHRHYPGIDNKGAFNILYAFARTLGCADAKSFHEIMRVEDPVAKLAAGPIHSAYCGWSYAEISEESHPSPDDNYYLLYDQQHSFEADSWLAKKKPASYCVCYMNAGYSTGWCEGSFDVELRTREILCRAKGDPCCRFIMGHISKVDEYVSAYKAMHPKLFSK